MVPGSSAVNPGRYEALSFPKLDAHQRREAMERLAKGETLVDVARTYGVDPTTIGRLQ